VKMLTNTSEVGAEKEFLQEAALMMKLRPHKNVVQLMGITSNPRAIVTEFVPGGSLRAFLDKPANFLNMEIAISFARQIIAGVGHLHQEGIVHRDLASRNVLIGHGNELKIADFGMSRVLLGEDSSKTQGNVGPLRWMAPESLTKKVYSAKSDIWSYAVTLVEILTRDTPFPTLSPYEVAVQVGRAGRIVDITSRAPAPLASLMRQCCAKEPGDRPSAGEIFENLSVLNFGENVEIKCGKSAALDH